ncbi:MAG: hypothetical protein KAU35_08365 [candidate division Zixibacteria bacterium]|nr:hypothetical protein [candidate division Zixibacteria bacterium]
MLGLSDISIKFLTDMPYLAWPALVVLLGLAVLLYHRTNPPLTASLRVFLAGLRIIAVAALFLAILEPVVGFTRAYLRPPRVALLLDRSASMDKSGSGITRSARMDSLLSSHTFAGLGKATDLATYHFGGNLVSAQEEVDRDRTSLGDVCYELEKNELAAPSDYWMLFSDGKSNSGRDPRDVAAGRHTPIIAIDMSAGGGGFDVSIADVNYNPVVFVDQPTDVLVKLNWRHGQNQNVKVELLSGNQILDSRRFHLGDEGEFGEVPLKYIPAQPGFQILKARIAPLEGEESTDNNQHSFAVKALKSRLLVLIVSDHPDHEVGFLKRFLSRSDKYEVELLATGSRAGNLGGRIPSRAVELNRYDLVVLHDPDPRKLESRREIIESYLSEKGGAMWVLAGGQFAASEGSEWFNRLLPFHPAGPAYLRQVEFQAEPAEGNLYHPAVRLAENQSSIRETWSQLPPFKSLVACNIVDPDAVILAWVPRSVAPAEKLPAIGYKRTGPGKTLMSAALPYWPWGFVSMGFGEDGANYGRFVEGAVSWLTVSDDFDPIRIAPQKDVFTRGEAVRFDGFAYDLGYRPIPAVSGTVKLLAEGNSDSYEIDVVSIGEGKYKAEFFNLPPGNYRYEGVFRKDGKMLEKNEGAILVESFSLEEYDQAGDPAGLAALARLSGGRYFTATEFDEAVAFLDLTPVEVREQREFVLWGRFWLLLVFIAALSLEWLARKMNQLI